MLIYLQLIDDPEEQSRFERLYTTYRSLMFHKANEILGNTQDAEDAVASCYEDGIDLQDLIKKSLKVITGHKFDR